MNIQVRTINVVTNADVFNQEDKKVLARINRLNLVNNNIITEYYLENNNPNYVDEETTPDEPEFIYKSIRISRRTFTDNQLDNLFNSTGAEITTGESFTAELAQIFADGLRRLVGQESLFGLNANDWEII